MDYPHSMIVRRKTVVSDGIGGQTETWAVAHSGLLCQVRQLSAEEIMINQKASKNTTCRIYCSDINVTISDMIEVTLLSETISDLYAIESLDLRRDISTGEKIHYQIDGYIRE